MIDRQPIENNGSKPAFPGGNGQGSSSLAEPNAPSTPRSRQLCRSLTHSVRPFAEAVFAARVWILMLGHLIVFYSVFWLAFAFRFDFAIPPDMARLAIVTIPWVLVIKLLVFYAFGQYHGWWRYVAFADLRALLLASFVSLAMLGLIDHFLVTQQIPRIVLILDCLLTVFALGGLRASVRAVREQFTAVLRHPHCKKALMVGADDAAGRLAGFMSSQSGAEYWIRGFVEMNGARRGDRLGQIPVLGNPEDLPRIAEKYAITDVLCPAGTLPGRNLRALMQDCDRLGLELKITPPCDDIFRGNGRMPTREIAIDDLLRREPARLDCESISHLIRGQVVMVTGAGGSIGSEICRQIACFQPKELILVGRGENRIFQIERELQNQLRNVHNQADGPGQALSEPAARLSRKESDGRSSGTPEDERSQEGQEQAKGPDGGTATPSCEIHACIADITDRHRMGHIFGRYQPGVVFHAAAHKHVPLMENNVGEAIKNNILGTKCLADTANEHGTSHFVMISTDKAVNPTSVMGTTKHLAERYVLMSSEQSTTRFVVTRFGNVLGSTQSVVPIFQEQIRDGGPITITDQRMRRFFMTIPEASQLVLQAAAMGTGGEIFVLEMGEPVKIIDLARDLIRLSGLPEDAVDIVETGIRPGEKLYEELYFDEEPTLPTQHPKLRAAYHRQYDLDQVRKEMAALEQYVHASNDSARQFLQRLVPEYRPLGCQQPAAEASPEHGTSTPPAVSKE